MMIMTAWLAREPRVQTIVPARAFVFPRSRWRLVHRQFTTLHGMQKNMLDASVTLDIAGQIALKRNVHLVLILWEETETPRGAIVLVVDFVIMVLDFAIASLDTLEIDGKCNKNAR